MFSFSVEKTKATRTRRLPILPRVGVVIDVAGHRICYRYAPLLETIRNLLDWGLSRSNLEKIQKEQMSEIDFPAEAKAQTLDVKARLVSETTPPATKFFTRFRR